MIRNSPAQLCRVLEARGGREVARRTLEAQLRSAEIAGGYARHYLDMANSARNAWLPEEYGRQLARVRDLHRQLSELN